MTAHLQAVKELSAQEDRAFDERERICGYLRYLQRKAESGATSASDPANQSTARLLRGIIEDIQDSKHYNPSYQR